MAGRLRVYTEFNQNALTLPEYFQHRFHDQSKILKIVSATIILFFFAIYCASGVVAGARLFENLFEVPYATALWYGALATILYTFIGGFSCQLDRYHSSVVNVVCFIPYPYFCVNSSWWF